MARRSKFMKIVCLILFKDSGHPATSFVDNRAGGKYRVKVKFPYNKSTPRLQEELSKLPHVIKVKYSNPPKTAKHGNLYDGYSITLDCRPSKAI